MEKAFFWSQITPLEVQFRDQRQPRLDHPRQILNFLFVFIAHSMCLPVDLCRVNEEVEDVLLADELVVVENERKLAEGGV